MSFGRDIGNAVAESLGALLVTVAIVALIVGCGIGYIIWRVFA